MLKKIYLVLFMVLGGALATQGHAQEKWPVGISCTVEDSQNQQSFDLYKTSNGPWVQLRKVIDRGGEAFALAVEATDRDGRGIVHLRNMRTGRGDVWYGSAATREWFFLEFEGWVIACQHFPFITR